MSYSIGIGAMLFLGAGLWYINSHDDVEIINEPDSPVQNGGTESKLHKAMSNTELNNPRNDIHVDSLTDKIHKNYASVDPKRHRIPIKNPKDFEGDAVWVTALGEAVETSNLHKEELLIGSLKESLKPDSLDQLKGTPPESFSKQPEFFRHIR